MLRYFGFSGFITLAAIAVAFIGLGAGAAITTIVLIAIEIAFSFDNAILNAKILERLSKTWQQLFLTIGMIFAIVGVRFVFPILIVMVTAGLGWGQVIDDALHHPDVYGKHLEEAHASISAFGGAFLLTLTLYFLFEARDILWLKRIERPLQKVPSGVWLPPLLSALVVILVGLFAGKHSGEVLRAGLIGVVSYAAIKIFIDALGKLAPAGQKIYTGWSAFLAFMYLQVLDASFSFDGVLGAFAITDQVLLIALGLGVGAIWVRSLTVFLVRNGTLNTYQFLEHGAHYAIFVLAAALLSSIYYEVPDAITGIVGLGVIGSSFVASREAMHAKRAKSSS
ncbi:MAG: hypothetical protein JWL89_353 [Candidatus Saccharibacteria bacterium]|nr:hypothetical protein [Candidatus Saccharibacteria bacterium]